MRYHDDRLVQHYGGFDPLDDNAGDVHETRKSVQVLVGELLTCNSGGMRYMRKVLTEGAAWHQLSCTLFSVPARTKPNSTY